MDQKSLPKLDRERYVREMREELERTLQEVADAVDGAPAGRVIRDSEHRARGRNGGRPKIEANEV